MKSKHQAPLNLKILYGLLAGISLAAIVVGIIFLPGRQSPISTFSSAPAPTTTVPPVDKSLNPLTGEHDMDTDNNRPVAFVVTDESSTLTQLNIESADMYFEAETEAGIPRMMAIYSSVDRIPDVIGPVRSARPHFVKMAKSLDTIYCHIGGSKTGRVTIQQLKLDHLNDSYEINDILKASDNVSWNRSAFVKDKVLKDIERFGYRTTSTVNPPFQFGDKTGDTPATTVNVKISASYHIAFTYNADTGLYEKHRNSLDTPVHVTYTGGTVATANVLVMFDNRTLDPRNDQRCDYDLESGVGVLASGGTSRPITWTRTNEQLSYFEADGTTPLSMAVGKTFICLTSDAYKDLPMVS